jgi:hypothetical protein
MGKIKRWMDKRRVVWSEPALPKYVKINPLSPPGAAQGLQPGDMSMLKVAEEFLEEPEDGLALSGPPDVPACADPGVRRSHTLAAWLPFAVAQYATYRVAAAPGTPQERTRSFQWRDTAALR